MSGQSCSLRKSMSIERVSLNKEEERRQILKETHMGDSQNEGFTLVPLNIKCRNIIYNQKGPIVLRTTHIMRYP